MTEAFTDVHIHPDWLHVCLIMIYTLLTRQENSWDQHEHAPRAPHATRHTRHTRHIRHPPPPYIIFQTSQVRTKEKSPSPDFIAPSYRSRHLVSASQAAPEKTTHHAPCVPQPNCPCGCSRAPSPHPPSAGRCTRQPAKPPTSPPRWAPARRPNRPPRQCAI